MNDTTSSVPRLTDTTPARAYLDDAEYPCDICGRMFDCDRCEHCSFGVTIGDALRKILAGESNDGERLHAARTLVRAGDWTSDPVVEARVRAKFPRQVAAALFDNGAATPARFVKASALPDAPVDWLWAGRLPRGQFVLTHGDPGSGKSLTGAKLAAHVSRGLPFPGDVAGPPADVLWIGHPGEDTPADIRSALIAADADMDRVQVLDISTAVSLAGAVKAAAGLSPALVVVDSASAWLADDGHTTNDADAVRGMLKTLQPLRAGGAVVNIITHDRKDREVASEAHLAAGSGQMMAGVRAALHVDGGMLTVTKMNGAARVAGLPFEVLPAEVNGRGFVRWLEADERPDPPDGRGGGLDAPTVDVGGSVGEVSAWVMAEYEKTGDGVTMNQIREGMSITNAKARGRLRATLDTAVREGRMETAQVTRRGVSRLGYLPALSTPVSPVSPVHTGPTGETGVAPRNTGLTGSPLVPVKRCDRSSEAETEAEATHAPNCAACHENPAVEGSPDGYCRRCLEQARPLSEDFIRREIESFGLRFGRPIPEDNVTAVLNSIRSRGDWPTLHRGRDHNGEPRVEIRHRPPVNGAAA